MPDDKDQWFEKAYLKKDLSSWIDLSFRSLREKFTICVTCWVNDEYDLLIDNAKNLKKDLDSFIGYLERKRKFG